MKGIDEIVNGIDGLHPCIQGKIVFKFNWKFADTATPKEKKDEIDILRWAIHEAVMKHLERFDRKKTEEYYMDLPYEPDGEAGAKTEAPASDEIIACGTEEELRAEYEAECKSGRSILPYPEWLVARGHGYNRNGESSGVSGKDVMDFLLRMKPIENMSAERVNAMVSTTGLSREQLVAQLARTWIGEFVKDMVGKGIDNTADKEQ